MTTLGEIENDLLNVDGSCRDINFSEEISYKGVTQVLEVISSLWSLSQATNEQGQEIVQVDFPMTLQREKGNLHTIWTGNEKLSHIQVFIFWDKENKYFCELTFFPNDFDTTLFNLNEFLSLMYSLVNAAESNEYYLRYENASWRHGTKPSDRSVIFSHENFVLPNSRSDGKKS